jgi:hypothetical protein
MQVLKDYRTYAYIAIVSIAIGTLFNININGDFASFGRLIIAIGGLSLIIAMKKKQDLDQAKKQQTNE